MARIAVAESESRGIAAANGAATAAPPDAATLAEAVRQTAHLCRVISSVLSRFSPSVVLSELYELCDRKVAAIEKALAGEGQ
jgi:hypothetical protein